MPKIPQPLINALRVEVDRTSLSRAARRLEINYSSVRQIYLKREHCADKTLKMLKAKLPTDGNQAEATVALSSVPVAAHPPAVTQYPPVSLKMHYSDQYWDDLRNAYKLAATGTSLSRLKHRRTEIKEMLQRGGSLQVLFVDPESPARRYSAIQEIGFGDPQSIKGFLRKQDETLDWLRKLIRENGEYSQKIECLKIDYTPTFGLDVIETKDGRKSIYVRFYPLMIDEGEEDRPIFEVGVANPLWYDFFEKQFERHLERASVWDCLVGRPTKRRK